MIKLTCAPFFGILMWGYLKKGAKTNLLKQMLKSIVVSLLCAFPSAIFLTGLGALLNYCSFEKREELLFYKTIVGGNN